MLMTMLNTVDRQIDLMAANKPETILGISAFSDHVQFIGDGSCTEQHKMTKKDLNDFEYCKAYGAIEMSKFVQKPVSETKDILK